MQTRIFDCQHCGACCVNPLENRQENYNEYIEVEPGDGILKKTELMRRYVAKAFDGKFHLLLTPDFRCKALLGAVGRRVRCEIYHWRPSPCRRVQKGSDLCLKYRRDQGL